MHIRTFMYVHTYMYAYAYLVYFPFKHLNAPDTFLDIYKRGCSIPASMYLSTYLPLKHFLHLTWQNALYSMVVEDLHMCVYIYYTCTQGIVYVCMLLDKMRSNTCFVHVHFAPDGTSIHICIDVYIRTYPLSHSCHYILNRKNDDMCVFVHVNICTHQNVTTHTCILMHAGMCLRVLCIHS
jgi:hypothetical protein